MAVHASCRTKMHLGGEGLDAADETRRMMP